MKIVCIRNCLKINKLLILNYLAPEVFTVGRKEKAAVCEKITSAVFGEYKNLSSCEVKKF